MASELVVKCCWCQESFVIDDSSKSILFCSPACSREYSLYIHNSRYEIHKEPSFVWEGIWDNVVRGLEG